MMNRRPPVASHTLSPHLDDERVFAAVDKYMTLNLSDEETGKYYQILNPKHLRAMLIKFLCAALGGLPYDGANMRKAHKRLRVPRRVMEKAVLHLRTALESVGGMSAHKTEEVIAYAEYLTLGPGSMELEGQDANEEEENDEDAGRTMRKGSDYEGPTFFPGLHLPLEEVSESARCPIISPEDRLWSDGQKGCAMAAKTLTRGDFDRLADALVERNTTHPTTQSYFLGVNVQALRRMQAAFLAHALGGPVYDVERMRRAHARLSAIVTHETFDAFLENLDVVLHETVGKDGGLILRSTQADIILLLAETTRKDIVPEALPRETKQSPQILSIGKRIRRLLTSPLRKYRSSSALKNDAVSRTAPLTAPATPRGGMDHRNQSPFGSSGATKNGKEMTCPFSSSSFSTLSNHKGEAMTCPYSANASVSASPSLMGGEGRHDDTSSQKMVDEKRHRANTTSQSPHLLTPDFSPTSSFRRE
ncbi:hypothetical protein BJ684DRAFT_18096 [Piptocephalis cylindrospora]|uniref:Uncharacterized protein n=1 Tax=Piptocephalis cylindrospora TaxID=1907219 RepID=A0A4P9XY30_9FUNG|nr:hypothetical protein BJ684DRAFT_18096 [Piptocephalis cylindrospora]|eukprot:RKP11298.1 hypothetical protein BJ684DRAFT_18096 [Piptocephalis cylindrospora]